MARTIKIEVLGDARNAISALSQLEKKTESTSSKMASSGKALSRNVTLPIVGIGVALIGLAGRQEDAEAKLSSTFKSMGASAWTSEEALKANASALQKVTTFGDETIIGMQDLLLTFGNLTNQVGEGNDIFDRTTKLGLDMSAALGQDLKSSAIQLGKALNDPIKGVTALQRVGVSFTEEQKEQIKTLVASGESLEAQKLILGELEKQFGGTAEAMAKTTQGKLKQALNDLGDAGESLGAVMLPMVAAVASKVGELARQFSDLPNPVKQAVVGIAGVAAAVGPVLLVVGKLSGPTGGLAKMKSGLLALGSHPVLAGLALLAGAIYLISKQTTGVVVDVEGLREAFKTAGGDASKAADQFLEAYRANEEGIILLGKAGVSFDDLSGAISGTDAAYEDFQKRVEDAYEAGKITDLEYQALRESTQKLRDETDLLLVGYRHVPGAMYDAGAAVAEYSGEIDEAIEGNEELKESAEALKTLSPYQNLIARTNDYIEAQKVVNALVDTGITDGPEYEAAILAEFEAFLKLQGAQEDVNELSDEAKEKLHAAWLSGGGSEEEWLRLVEHWDDLADSIARVNSAAGHVPEFVHPPEPTHDTGYRPSFVNGLAGGTTFWGGGSALVGEAGRELVDLPRGARVTPALTTERLLSRGGDRGRVPVVVPIQLTLDGRVVAEALREFEIGYK